MKKFKFRLQSLLKVREHMENQRKKDLADANRQVMKQESELETLSQKNDNTIKGKRKNQSGNISIAELLVYSRYLLKLRQNNLAGRELLSALYSTKEKKRRELLEASKERKVYEKLKEHDEERFNKEATDSARKESDETGINTFRLKHEQQNQYKHSSD
ncbi:MAG: flagellar export protein FliJ [candidate division Zixibacteria bacterium]|nr:flagellar export protein FliJ [candidate division Zixibacteria bacterium]